MNSIIQNESYKLDHSFLLNKTILLAEDDEVSQQQLQIVFGRLGASVELAENGVEVLHKMMTLSPALLVLDLHLHPFNSIELVKSLRIEHKISAPVLGLSAANMSGRAVAAGVNAVVRKPIEMSELHSRVYGLFAG